jgi:hypothetical protein
MTMSLVHRIAVVALCIAMFASTGVAGGLGNCGGACCQRVSAEMPPAVSESAHCCSSSGPQLGTIFDAAGGPAFHCCKYANVAPTSILPLRDARFDGPAQPARASGPFCALHWDASDSHSFAGLDDGPFWSAPDGPSRQAFLCRFTI